MTGLLIVFVIFALTGIIGTLYAIDNGGLEAAMVPFSGTVILAFVIGALAQEITSTPPDCEILFALADSASDSLTVVRAVPDCMEVL